MHVEPYHWAMAISCYYLCVCVCVFVRVFHEMIWVPLSLMKFKWQIPSRWLLYHLQGAPDVAIEVRIEMIHAFCVCVSLKYFHQGSPKNSIYTVYQIIPKVFSRWRGATSNISYNIIYKIIIYICICKTNQGPLFNIPNSPGYKLYRVWSLMVLFGWKPTELFWWRSLDSTTARYPRSSDNGEDGQLIISSQGEEKATSGVLEGCQLMRMETCCPLFSVLQKNISWSCS